MGVRGVHARRACSECFVVRSLHGRRDGCRRAVGSEDIVKRKDSSLIDAVLCVCTGGIDLRSPSSNQPPYHRGASPAHPRAVPHVASAALPLRTPRRARARRRAAPIPCDAQDQHMRSSSRESDWHRERLPHTGTQSLWSAGGRSESLQPGHSRSSTSDRTRRTPISRVRFGIANLGTPAPGHVACLTRGNAGHAAVPATPRHSRPFASAMDKRKYPP
eukprot:COSAG02_NODE_6525_length_3519_cov_3.419298_1_plen_218_part_00